MPIAKITGQGLAAIAFSTALLWGCAISQNIQQRKAFVERARVMRNLQLMQRRGRPEPVSLPVPRIPRRPRTVAG